MALKYSEQLIHDANRLRFPALVEREFQEAYYNVKAHQFISQWGLIPALCILSAFWAGDYVGFTEHLDGITVIRILSLMPLIAMIYTRNTEFMRRRIRVVSSAYLFFLACSVLSIVAITPHTDFAHRGYTMSFPMVVFIMFLAKPHLSIGLGISIGFTILFNTVNILFDVMPLGHAELISHVHINLVMVSSIVIGAVTCYVLETAERREFIRKKIIEQDREIILLQQAELSDAVEEQRRLNATLDEQNKTLDALNQEKNEFMGIAAHDLKNPLAGITLQTSTLKRYINRMSHTDITKIADTIESAAARMKDIVTTLLDVNAIESNRVLPHPEHFHISGLLRTVVDEYAQRTHDKHIHIVTDVELTIYCFADKSITHQVVDNLFSNAIKFTPPGGTVSLRARHAGDMIQIDISDTGPGLTDDDKQKLFKKFQRLSAKPTAGEHSTGLGLSIVLKLVEMMNGKIWCESLAGHGATFSVSLPRGSQIRPSVVAHRTIDETVKDT
ncbi:MAG: HAMP domain-containing histidine kinase [Candidatus Kapabacteria bacterium]|nr:HAMP domain-containing histidine kinase [Candidatus Kapabacteria bacterium]